MLSGLLRLPVVAIALFVPIFAIGLFINSSAHAYNPCSACIGVTKCREPNIICAGHTGRKKPHRKCLARGEAGNKDYPDYTECAEGRVPVCSMCNGKHGFDSRKCGKGESCYVPESMGSTKCSTPKQMKKLIEKNDMYARYVKCGGPKDDHMNKILKKEYKAAKKAKSKAWSHYKSIKETGKKNYNKAKKHAWSEYLSDKKKAYNSYKDKKNKEKSIYLKKKKNK